MRHVLKGNEYNQPEHQRDDRQAGARFCGGIWPLIPSRLRKGPMAIFKSGRVNSGDALWTFS